MIQKITERNKMTKISLHNVINKGGHFLAAHDEVSRDYTDLWRSPTLALTPTQTLFVV